MNTLDLRLADLTLQGFIRRVIEHHPFVKMRMKRLHAHRANMVWEVAGAIPVIPANNIYMTNTLCGHGEEAYRQKILYGNKIFLV